MNYDRGQSSRELARELLPQLRRDYADAQNRAREARAEALRLWRVINGIEELTGQTGRTSTPAAATESLFSEESVTEAEGPRGQEAVRQLMLTEPHKVWKLKEISRGIIDRGWITPNAKVPEAAIRAATQRLAADGSATKVEAGAYRLTEKGRASKG